MLPSSAKDATNLWYPSSISTKHSHPGTIVYVLYYPLALSTHPQPIPLWGLAVLSLEPLSVFAYAVPIHTAHIHWFLLKNPQFLLFLLHALP